MNNHERINTITKAWDVKLITLTSASAAITRLMPRCHRHPAIAAYATDERRRPVCGQCYEEVHRGN